MAGARAALVLAAAAAAAGWGGAAVVKPLVPSWVLPVPVAEATDSGVLASQLVGSLGPAAAPLEAAERATGVGRGLNDLVDGVLRNQLYPSHGGGENKAATAAGPAPANSPLGLGAAVVDALPVPLTLGGSPLLLLPRPATAPRVVVSNRDVEYKDGAGTGPGREDPYQQLQPRGWRGEVEGPVAAAAATAETHAALLKAYSSTLPGSTAHALPLLNVFLAGTVRMLLDV